MTTKETNPCYCVNVSITFTLYVLYCIVCTLYTKYVLFDNIWETIHYKFFTSAIQNPVLIKRQFFRSHNISKDMHNPVR